MLKHVIQTTALFQTSVHHFPADLWLRFIGDRYSSLTVDLKEKQPIPVFCI